MARSPKKANEQFGDVLGLGGAAGSAQKEAIGSSLPNRTPDDPARRHRGMSEGADELTQGAGDSPHGTGATSIDMGSGGEGTDIE